MMHPYEVIYTGARGHRSREVIAVICPSMFNQLASKFKVSPIFVSLGDAKVDWELTTPALENFLRNQMNDRYF